MSKKSASDAARELSRLGAAKGGKARAEKLTPEQRSETARLAAETRWGAKAKVNASHVGRLQIANSEIECAVLEDGRRVLTQETFLTAIGRSAKGKGGQILSSPDGLPPFLSATALKPFITQELRESTVPVIYRSQKATRAFGYEATLLPKVCEVYLNARDAGTLTKQQMHIAKACDILIRGLAHVGIIALVDEATGYQYDRERNALAEILEQFISKELVKWAKRFPNEFYSEIFRLKNKQRTTLTSKRPLWFGKITLNLVYQRLAPGVLDELQRLTPRHAKGRLKHKLHQRLTEDVGHDKLKDHFIKLITLMNASVDWEQFKGLVDRSLPKYKELPLFDGHDDEAE